MQRKISRNERRRMLTAAALAILAVVALRRGQAHQSGMTLTLAQLAPIVCAGFAAAVMVRLGTAHRMLVIRRPHRCASCGLEREDCRC